MAGIYSDFLITADFDGTLTDGKSAIPQRNRDAIHEFIAQGGTFTVNTGRSVPMYASRLGQVETNAPLLLYNGGAAYDPDTGELLYARTIPLDLWETVLKVHELVPEMIIEVQGIKGHFTHMESETWARMNEILHCSYGFVKPGEDLGPFLKFALLGPYRPGERNIFAGSPADEPRIDQVIARLRAYLGDNASIFRSGSRVVDIQAPGVSKAKSARWLQERLGKKYLICIGDGENDVPMLEGADFAFCPGDAVVADRFATVCNCADGAVADVIYKKIPEILRK